MALNEKMKNRFRRVIRVLMVVLAALLLVLGLGVPVANNALAMGLSRRMAALPLPEDTTLVETASLAGRLTNPRGSIQYFGALLLESERPLEEIQAHYAQYNESLTASYHVGRQSGQAITALGDTSLSFRASVGDTGYYIVHTLRTGGHALQWWLDMDTRG